MPVPKISRATGKRLRQWHDLVYLSATGAKPWQNLLTIGATARTVTGNAGNYVNESTTYNS